MPLCRTGFKAKLVCTHMWFIESGYVYAHECAEKVCVQTMSTRVSYAHEDIHVPRSCGRASGRAHLIEQRSVGHSAELRFETRTPAETRWARTLTSTGLAVQDFGILGAPGGNQPTKPLKGTCEKKRAVVLGSTLYRAFLAGLKSLVFLKLNLGSWNSSPASRRQPESPMACRSGAPEASHTVPRSLHSPLSFMILSKGPVMRTNNGASVSST